MEYKYAIGQRVRVRESLELKKRYKMFYSETSNGINSKMKKWCGKTVTIAEHFVGRYKILEDGGFWKWTDEMFEDEEMKDFEKRFFNKKIVAIVSCESHSESPLLYHEVTLRLEDGEVYQVITPKGVHEILEKSKIVRLERKILEEKEVIAVDVETVSVIFVPLNNN